MRTSRPVAEKLGTVRQDPDLHGLLFTLISRATGGRQERAARACCHLATRQGRGLSKASLDRESAPRRTLRHTGTAFQHITHRQKSKEGRRRDLRSAVRGPRSAVSGVGSLVLLSRMEKREIHPDPPSRQAPTSTTDRDAARISLSL